jgi:hypothetical protein
VLERRAAEEPAVVPVQVVAGATSDKAGALEVVPRNDRSVRVVPGFDAATSRRRLVVLEEEAPC